MTNPAETYESYMVPALFAPWAAKLVDTAAPQPGERVLDVACGTAIVARRASARVGATGKVHGLDMNPKMLEVARAVAEREGLDIELHEGRADALPFSDGSFDLILCQQGLQFFPDRQGALGEMRRVLAAGGRVAISVWQHLERHPFFEALFGAVERHLGISGVAAPFSLGDEARLRALLTDAGFEAVDVQQVSMATHYPEPERFLAQTVRATTAAIPAVQHLDDSAQQSLFEALQSEMEPPVRAATNGERVSLDFHAHVARATRGS